MSEKCLVKGCPNHKHEGKFIGDLCAPCATYLKEGRIGPSEAWFVEAIKQRNELLVALKEVKLNAGNPERVYEITKAIISKVEGEKRAPNAIELMGRAA